MTTVLLTDGEQRSTLAAVRALGSRDDIQVVVSGASANSLAARSRYCAAAFAYPSPYHDERGFLDAMLSGASSRSVDLVVPMTDVTCAVLSEHRDAFRAPTRVAVPDPETFWSASDKIALNTLACRVGVPTPTTHVIVQPPGEAPPEDVAFPCVVKPSRSRVRTSCGWMKTAVFRAQSRSELEHLVHTRPECQHPYMLQTVVDGDGLGIFALCDHGEPLVLFAHRRLREKPPSGGVSVLREAVPVDPVAGDYSTRLLRALRWHGAAMVEFKQDRATATPYLMEVNGRFWGSLQLAIDAGINFPLHVVRLWLGEAPSCPSSYRTGIRSRWLLGDVDHLLMRLSGNGAQTRDAPPLGRLLVDFCRFFRADTRYEVESLRDPGPSIHEMRRYLGDTVRAVRNGLRH